MNRLHLKVPLLAAVMYFGMNVNAQTKPHDSVGSEKKIDEVVLIGYGSRKKSDVTGSINQIPSQEVTKQKVLNPTQAIQGKAAGVQVTASDTPGASPVVYIRGLGTALGGRDPLYIVDGVPMNNVNSINANDIESYDILKDAASLAIYGNRAANGVILITTKKGKGGRMNMEYEGFMGTRSPLKTVKMADADQFAAYNNAIQPSTKYPFAASQPYNTDWFKEITRPGFYTQNNLSLSGSTNLVNYFFSLGYYDEDAILKGLSYNRTTFRNNNEFKLSNKLKLTQSINVAYTNSTPKPFNAFTYAYQQSPAIPVRWGNGYYGLPYVGASGVFDVNGSLYNNAANPVMQLDKYNERQRNLNATGSLTAECKIVDALKFTSQFGMEYGNWQNYKFDDTKAIWQLQNPVSSNPYSPTAPINTLEKNRANYFNWNFTNYFNYSKKFGIHNIDATLGSEITYYGSEEKLGVTRRDVPSNSNYWALDFATSNASDKITNTVSNAAKLISYFARAQYTLLNRYMVSATIRRDGSSKYQDGKKWGNFPSFGLAWTVTNENFLKNNGAVDLFKIRGGWGRLGNQNVPLNYQSFATGLNTSLGGSILYPGITIASQIDPNLTWEITEESSAGVDLEFLKHKLKGSFDIYNKKNTNAILNVLPYITSGISNASPGHVGQISNKGVEASLRWDDKVNEDFRYYLGGNFSHNKNNVDKIYGNLAQIQGGGLGNGQWTKTLQEGQPLGAFYLWEVRGVNPVAGGQPFIYKDLNGDGMIDGKDRRFFGSAIPVNTFGVNAGFTYKQLDFSVDGYGVSGNYVYNAKKAQKLGNQNVEVSVATDYYSATNPNSVNPIPSNVGPWASNYYLEKGDFFRVTNITVGYTVPEIAGALRSLRLYISAINPFISQKFSGFTPELPGDNDPYGSYGMEIDAYPTLRTFILGANIKF